MPEGEIRSPQPWLSTGRIMACAVVSGSVAGWWFIRATPAWPVDNSVLRILCPDALLRPMLVALPAISTSHSWCSDKYGKKSTSEWATSQPPASGHGLAMALPHKTAERMGPLPRGHFSCSHSWGEC